MPVKRKAGHHGEGFLSTQDPVADDPPRDIIRSKHEKECMVEKVEELNPLVQIYWLCRMAYAAIDALEDCPAPLLSLSTALVKATETAVAMQYAPTDDPHSVVVFK